MQPFLRALHSLAVALWFGAVAFFAVAALLIFDAFQGASALPAAERPAWLPLPALYDRPAPEGFPDPLRLEQGSRAAGAAVGRVFPTYYALQLGCAAVALLTAWLLSRGGEGRWHQLRVWLCAAALATAAAGWAMERHVAALRVPRNERSDAALAASADAREQLDEARAARRAFGMWHGLNLLQSYATLALAGALVVLVPSLASPRAARPGAC